MSPHTTDQNTAVPLSEAGSAGRRTFISSAADGPAGSGLPSAAALSAPTSGAAVAG